jgi:putative restriction endonuclease
MLALRVCAGVLPNLRGNEALAPPGAAAMLRPVVGTTDADIRRSAFDWLTDQREIHRDAIPRAVLASYTLNGRSVPLVGPSGIWKPAVCQLPISIATVCNGPYPDNFDDRSATVRYAYRRTGPDHRDNVGLRRAMAEQVPLVYFHCLEPGFYLAAFPTFVVGDDRAAGIFTLQIDDVGASILGRKDSRHSIAEDRSEVRRAYVTRTVHQRLHQVAFRERVVRAYHQRCALCRLRHLELLDAAHITPDRDPEGLPLVSNGVALCKLHHAAFDSFFFTIKPDYRVEVRGSILAETDGPMLVVGLQQIHNLTIGLPRRAQDWPDPERLRRRYEAFLSAS